MKISNVNTPQKVQRRLQINKSTSRPLSISLQHLNSWTCWPLSTVEAALGRQFMQQKSAWDDLRGTSPATRHSYVHIAHTRYTHTCVITVSPHMWIQIYCTVLYCLPYCLVVSYMPPPQFATFPAPLLSHCPLPLIGRVGLLQCHGRQ